MFQFSGSTGLNICFVRVPTDNCDYALEECQAVKDLLADHELSTFSLARDKQYILPMPKEALFYKKVSYCDTFFVVALSLKGIDLFQKEHYFIANHPLQEDDFWMRISIRVMAQMMADEVVRFQGIEV